MEQTISLQRLWTAVDIAAYTQLNPGTIRNMQSKGQLPDPLRIGRSVRWNSADVIAFFAEMQAA
jgi:predicted DNA-binding transcriptional regulator AlpA